MTPVIDTGRPYHTDGAGGSLYVCSNCVQTMAGLIGWVPPHIHSEIKDQLDDTLEKLNTSELHNEQLQVLLDAIESTKVAREAPRPRKGK